MTIPRISKKRLKKLGKMPFSSISKKPKPLRKRPRKPSETLRIYGGKKRIEWVKSLPCAACGVVGYSENAHVAGESGVGYKADAEFIAPLCGYAQVSVRQGYIASCHRLFDEFPEEFRARFPGFNPEDAARSTNEAWIAYSGSSPIRGKSE